MKKEIIDLYSNISMPDGAISNYIEKENYIEFICDDITYAVLINGENWEEIKNELLLKEERKLMANLQIQESEKQDTLTKLYNKKYSRQIIEEFLEKSDPNSHHALMIVDINNFSIVNENLGYLFGDTVLMNIADSLRKIFYDTDIAARIGGDEFLIFLKNVSNRDLMQARAEEICAVFNDTYTGDNKDYTMSCSIGIAMYPANGSDYMQLFINADSALLYARQNKQNHFIFCKEIIDGSNENNNDCYEKYKITKTRAYGTTNFDKEMTAFAFDIMSRTKDVNSAINLLLNKVVAQFDCNHICIIENSMTNLNFKITYLGSKNGIKSRSDKFNLDTILNLKDFANNFEENGICFINDTSQLLPSEHKSRLDSMNIKALLQCGIFEDGIFKGCVSIDDCEKPRYWTQYEVDSLVTIAKIISSYLLKLRASERANQKLYKIRNFDALTGLPTLHKFKKDVTQLIKEHPEQSYAIIYSDISQFKYINDSLGYDIGDKILCDFANLLSGEDLGIEKLCRRSEDNFLAVVKNCEEEVLKKSVLSINEQFNMIQKTKYPANKFVIISGISVIDSSKDISVAIDNANNARKSVKGSLMTVCKFFDTSMKEKLEREAEITNNMEDALKNGEFIVYLQPKIGLSENKLVGAEALVRWKKEDDTLMPPNDFIPLFEKNGFVVNLDFYVYEEVCKLIRTWLDEGLQVVPISLNVSRIHLNDEEFVNEIQRLVDEYKIPYHLLELELTESIFLNNTEVALLTMRNLRELGFGVSIDDFGAGYSSLNLLKEMATDVIKLDKEFFGHGEMKKEEKIIVSSIISMAKQLNMKVLSEGVETQKQSDFLKSVYCDMAQGFLYSKPMPISEFEKLIRQQ